MPSVDDCAEHGQQEIRGRVQVGDVRHVTLVCGCTIETIDSTLREGDIVLYYNVLFRVKRLSENEVAVIVNNLGEKTVDVLDFDRVAADTITGLRPHGEIDVSVDDWVQHRELGIRAKVLQLRKDGKFKVEIFDAVRIEFVRYVWAPNIVIYCEPDEIYLEEEKREKRSPYARSGLPGQASIDWGGEEYRRLVGTSSRTTSVNMTPGLHQSWTSRAAPPKPKKKTANVTMGGLIKDEVERLEAEDGTVVPRNPSLTHFGASRPKKQKTAESLEVIGPVSKRKGTW